MCVLLPSIFQDGNEWPLGYVGVIGVIGDWQKQSKLTRDQGD